MRRGQRRYVESLSSYARQFLGQMEKPDVDFIEGLSPAISIDQKSTSRNPRSTVGTITEVYDYLRVLYARIGHPHCPQCGRSIGRQNTRSDRRPGPSSCRRGTKFQILAPVVRGRKGEYGKMLLELAGKGFRACAPSTVRPMSCPSRYAWRRTYKQHDPGRRGPAGRPKPDLRRRLADSIETALGLTEGIVEVAVMNHDGTEDIQTLLTGARLCVLRPELR